MASSDVAHEPPPKRQKVAEPRPLLRDLPADEFLKHAALWNSPPVTVLVHRTEFKVPKDLLCYNSSYFNSAFNGSFKEGEEQKMIFQDCSAETFQLAVQWIYFSQINVPVRQATVQEAPVTVSNNANQEESQSSSHKAICSAGEGKAIQSRQSPIAATELEVRLRAWVVDEGLDMEFYPDFQTNEKAQTISRLLSFLKLADKIDLIGPFDSVVAGIKQAIQTSPNRRGLLPGHIRLAAELSPTHPVRKLLADACFREFVQDLMPHDKSSKLFRFDRELNELDAFSSDLLRSYRSSEKRRQTSKKNGGVEFAFVDPFLERGYVVSA